MMYMDDAIRATVTIMEAPLEAIKIRTSYNLASLEFSPEDLVKELIKYFPKLKIKYKPDLRDKLAQTWPESIDDSHARNDWGWTPKFNLSQMVEEIVLNLNNRYKKELI